MSWNYRIVRYKDGSGYGLHEVYFDPDFEGSEYAMTERPISFTCGEDEEPDVIIDALVLALKDACRVPVFDEPERWGER